MLISEIFRSFGPEYIQRFGKTMPSEHHKVIQAIIQCRTSFYGMTIYTCPDCGQTHHVFRSCGNRHCPQCQHHKTQKWLEKQLDRQIPVPHFLITFTVPQQLRSFIRSHQKACYEALFHASSEALKFLAKDPRFLGTDLPGFTGILHTWGRQLQFHPHIHYIVPGGGISSDRSAWIASRADFYVPVKALSPIFRAKFKEQMHKAGLLNHINPKVWKPAWVVNSQAVGNGSASLKYLAPYVFKVAISNSRIIKVENRTVTFKYRKHGSSEYRSTSLDVIEFIRRFLQHVLPSGFMKVRHFGFMSPNCSLKVADIRKLIQKQTDILLPQTIKSEAYHGPHCPDCGGRLIFLKSILPLRRQFRASG
jgi:DNA-directed RNA polymerase subunit RPC12/RpoP